MIKEYSKNNRHQEIESLKSSGVKCSRQELYRQGYIFYQNNKEVLNEARIENKVLSMKRFYHKKGWSFPPRLAYPAVADLINNYYKKHLVDYKK